MDNTRTVQVFTIAISRNNYYPDGRSVPPITAQWVREAMAKAFIQDESNVAVSEGFDADIAELVNKQM